MVGNQILDPGKAGQTRFPGHGVQIRAFPALLANFLGNYYWKNKIGFSGLWGVRFSHLYVIQFFEALQAGVQGLVN